MLKLLPSLCLAAVCLALPGSSQASNCSTLAATVLVDPVVPAQTLTIDVVGTTPLSPVVLAISTNTGTTTVNMRAFGILSLGLQSPYTTLLLGLSDVNGDLQNKFRFRTGLGVTRYLQSVTISAKSGSPTQPSLCTSNVVAVDLQ